MTRTLPVGLHIPVGKSVLQVNDLQTEVLAVIIKQDTKRASTL